MLTDTSKMPGRRSTARSIFETQEGQSIPFTFQAKAFPMAGAMPLPRIDPPRYHPEVKGLQQPEIQGGWGQGIPYIPLP